MINHIEKRLRRLEKKFRWKVNPVLIVREAEDGSFLHAKDDRPVTQEEINQADVIINNNIPRVLLDDDE